MTQAYTEVQNKIHQCTKKEEILEKMLREKKRRAMGVGENLTFTETEESLAVRFAVRNDVVDGE